MRDKRTERLMQGMPLDTSSLMAQSVAGQVLSKRTCVLVTCTRCGRMDYTREAETGLCLVCIDKEMESA